MEFALDFIKNIKVSDCYLMASLIGAAIAMGLGAIGAAIGIGIAAGRASESITRQPSSAGEVTKTMLVGQAVNETPAIFSLVIAMVLMLMKPVTSGYFLGFLGLIGAGLSIGFGALGSGIGGGLANMEACVGTGRNHENSENLLKTMIVGQAMGQSSVVFAMIISFYIIFNVDYDKLTLPGSFALLASGICMGSGAIGPGFGLGLAARAGVAGGILNPENSNIVTRTMLVGQAVTESAAIFSFIIALLLIVQNT
ncbi:MAG: ATP synthase F0, C subunit [uncultured bacterium]|nr:MAG: ATP synthase F0, C subunit [uncultured bacterium]